MNIRWGASAEFYTGGEGKKEGERERGGEKKKEGGRKKKVRGMTRRKISLRIL